MMKYVWAMAVVSTLSSTALSARADDATATFERGVAEHDAGNCESVPIGDAATCARAADDFKSAYALNPSALGALRNLAYTERGLGRVASARAHFLELAEKAPNDPKPERRAWASHAIEEADALASRVPYLTLHPPTPASAGMIVQVDGSAVALSTPLALDPGEHQVHAEAPGIPPFDALVAVAERDQKHVDIRWPAPETPVPAGSAAAIAPAHPAPQPAPKPVSATHHSHVGPIVFGITGAGVTALGLAFGGAALAERNANCDSQNVCAAGTLGTIRGLAVASTVFMVIGGAGLATGIVWYVLTPSGSPASPSAALVFTPRSASAVVRF